MFEYLSTFSAAATAKLCSSPLAIKGFWLERVSLKILFHTWRSQTNLVLLHAPYLLIIIFKAFLKTKYFTNMLKTLFVFRINYDVASSIVFADWDQLHQCARKKKKRGERMKWNPPINLIRVLFGWWQNASGEKLKIEREKSLYANILSLNFMILVAFLPAFACNNIKRTPRIAKYFVSVSHLQSLIARMHKGKNTAQKAISKLI